MKKIGIGIGIIVLLFLLLVYFSVSSTNDVNSTSIIKNIDDVEAMDFTQYDSVLIAPSYLYEANSLKTIMQGEQYRKAWSTPTSFPIVYLDTVFGGLKVQDEGGGKQTHSLELKSKDGLVYTLRSINKDPKPLIPEWAKTLGLENIVVDGISAQHPYAAIAVAQLSETAEVLHTDPKAVFIPKQKALGKYNAKYGDKIYLLEHETDGGKNWTKYQNVQEIVDTEDLQELKVKYGPKIEIDKKALIRARLFDILIGDWDRHAKQWGWAISRNGDSFKAIPIPGDRDNAFFKIGGIIPSILSNKSLLPGLQSFDKDIDFLPGLVMPFDVYFLRNSSEKDFISEARTLQNLISDSRIKESFAIWPEDIYMLDGEEIMSTIKYRRDNLEEIALEFFEILNNKELLTEPLKGSEELDLPESLVRCFDCP